MSVCLCPDIFKFAHYLNQKTVQNEIEGKIGSDLVSCGHYNGPVTLQEQSKLLCITRRILILFVLSLRGEEIGTLRLFVSETIQPLRPAWSNGKSPCMLRELESSNMMYPVQLASSEKNPLCINAVQGFFFFSASFVSFAILLCCQNNRRNSSEINL